MIFIKTKDFDLTDERPEVFIDLLNEEHQGSQLGRLPFTPTSINDEHNLILGIRVHIGNKEKRLIGRVSLENINYINQSAELKIFITKEFQGKGYGYNACKEIIDHSFKQLNLNRIYAGTLSNNQGFQKLAELLKMTKEGERIKAVYKNNEFVNVIEYGLLKEVWYA